MKRFLFLGHQIPIITTAGIETDRGSCDHRKKTPLVHGSKTEKNPSPLITSMDSSKVNGPMWSRSSIAIKINSPHFLMAWMVNTSALANNELPELRMSDWFVGGPGAYNSQQFFAGQMDDLRIYDKALSPEDISRIYNGGEEMLELSAWSLLP